MVTWPKLRDCVAGVNWYSYSYIRDIIKFCNSLDSYIFKRLDSFNCINNLGFTYFKNIVIKRASTLFIIPLYKLSVAATKKA